MKKLCIAIAAVLLTGCAGVTKISPPGNYPAGVNVKTISKPREVVWNTAVPALGKQFFVINNLDKSSGLINISYSGNPERYIDCGKITSTVSNARGERHYSFPAASANQTYEVMNNMQLFFINRKMKLEGRMNLVFEETGPNETRVSANTRYVVSRTAEVRNTQGASRTFSESISFNSGSRETFPKSADGQGVECTPTGALESEVLAIIN